MYEPIYKEDNKIENENDIPEYPSA
jgi:hypothetical protein